jgi:Leucine-rich repeat (LRR) protein
MQTFFLGNCSLNFQPDLVDHTVRELYLNTNRLTTIFAQALPNGIEVLHAEENRIHSDGLPIVWPDTIKEIYLQKNQIQETDGIHWPQNLVVLNLSFNPLMYFPFMVPDTTEKINLDYTLIRKIDNLPTKLKELNINESKLRRLPHVLPNDLEILEAKYNSLSYKSLPSSWGNSLRYLNLTYNRLTQVPTNLPDTLEHLVLSQNQITSVPAHLPPNLKTLILAKNRIRTVATPYRINRIQLVILTDNQTTETIEHTQNHWAITIDEIDNWNHEEHHTAARTIQNTWKKMKFRTGIFTLIKTQRLREELLATAMHPSRAGLFEDIAWQ